MKTKLLFLFLLTLFAMKQSVSAQNYFARNYSSGSYDACFTNDSGFLALTGFWDGVHKFDVLFKCDANKNFQWAKGYVSNDFLLEGWQCIESNTGGYAISGIAWQYSAIGYQGKVFMLKTNASGNIVWSKFWSAPMTNSTYSLVQSYNDNSYYILGGGCASVFFILKINQNGNLVWAKNYSSAGGGHKMIQTSDGNLIVSGSKITATGEGNVCNLIVTKINPNGDILWNKAYNVDGRGDNIIEMPAGGYFVSGFIYIPSAPVWHGNYFTVLIDNAGNPINVNYSDVMVSSRYTNAFADSSGILAVIIPDSTALGRIFIKSDNAGNILWTKLVPGNNNARARQLKYDIDNNPMIISDGIMYEKLDHSFTQFCNGYSLITPSFLSTVPQEISSGPAAPFDIPYTLAALNLYDSTFVYTWNDCIVASVEEENNLFPSINIFPNPATSAITIESGEFKVERIEMWNVAGERVIAPLNPLKGTSASIDVSKLTPGIYFVTLTDATGNKAVRKVVKM